MLRICRVASQTAGRKVGGGVSNECAVIGSAVCLVAYDDRGAFRSDFADNVSLFPARDPRCRSRLHFRSTAMVLFSGCGAYSDVAEISRCAPEATYAPAFSFREGPATTPHMEKVSFRVGSGGEALSDWRLTLGTGVYLSAPLLRYRYSLSLRAQGEFTRLREDVRGCRRT